MVPLSKRFLWLSLKLRHTFQIKLESRATSTKGGPWLAQLKMTGGLQTPANERHSRPHQSPRWNEAAQRAQTPSLWGTNEQSAVVAAFIFLPARRRPAVRAERKGAKNIMDVNLMVNPNPAAQWSEDAVLFAYCLFVALFCNCICLHKCITIIILNALPWLPLDFQPHIYKTQPPSPLPLSTSEQSVPQGSIWNLLSE